MTIHDSYWSEKPSVVTDENGVWIAAWSTNDDLGGTIGDDADIDLARWW